VFDAKLIEKTIDYTVEKFLITNDPVMELAMNVLDVLNKIGKITIKGKDESCPATVSVANIITQNVLNGTTKTDKISEKMSSKFRWVEPETELEDAIQKMLNSNIRRLVILDDNKLVGIITQTDLTGFLRDKLLVDKTILNIQKN